jgi:glycosyltransferase involved in cell wall biosynthesis
MLVRNEAAEDRYLRRVILDAQRWASDIVVLDDNSTDGTPELVRNLGCIVYTRDNQTPAWGAEAPARAQLWDLAAQHAGDGWVLVLDADMLLVGDPRPLCESWDCDAWAWPLRDLWDDEEHFRVDGAWAYGPVTPRPWLFRPSALREPPRWRDSRLHSGHAPANFAGLVGIAPDLVWHHLSYVKPEHSRVKHAQYMQFSDSLSAFERAHADSIADG